MPKTLLLADDSITIQKVVGITFAAEDYQITAVDNGEDAIAKARQMKPDIVLADVVMPRKNGYEVCEAIKADPGLQRIPVLLLAGTFEAFDENRARAARADGHIAKPFESGALIAKVRELVEGLAPAAQPAAPARPAAPQPAPAAAPHGAPAAAARPAAAPAPAAPRPGMPGAMPPGGRPTMPGAASPAGFRPAGAAPPAGMRPTMPGAVPPAGFRPTMPGAMPPGARPPGPMPGAGMRPPGPGMGPRPGMPFPGAPPAGARSTMPLGRPPVAGPVPGARAPMQPAAPAARPAAPFPGARAPAPAAPEHRARESFGFDMGPGPVGEPPTEVETDFGDLGAGAKPAVSAGKPAAAVRGGVPKEVALAGAPAGGPAPIDLGQEEAGEVELAPMHAFVPPAAATGHRPEARAPGDAGEAALREALSKASLEVIERVVWEVVPQLAETIIRENLERLAKERQGA